MDRMLHKDGVLIIQQAAIQDTGIYVCELNNSVGVDKSETKLLVSGKIYITLHFKSLKLRTELTK